MDFALATLVVVSVLSTVLSTGAAWVAWSAANEAKAEATSISGLISVIRQSESEVERLDTAFRSLRGLVYKRTSDPDSAAPDVHPQLETPEAIRSRLRAQHGLPMMRGGAPNGADSE